MEKVFLGRTNIAYLLQKKTVIRLCILMFSIMLVLPLSSCSVFCANDNNCIQYSSLSLSSFCISDLDITLNVKGPDNIIITEEYTFENNLNTSIVSVDLYLNMSYSNLTIENTINKTQLNYDQFSSSESIRVYFESVIESNASRSIQLSYSLEFGLPLIPNKHSYYMFSYFTTLAYYTEDFRVTSRLPEYCYLHETDDFLPYTPHNITANFLSGTRITLIWDFDDLPEDSIIEIQIFFDEPAKNTPIWLFIVGPIVGVAFGVLTSFYFFRRKDQKNVKKIGDMFLSDVQKQLLRLIHSKGGKLSQTELCKITSYTRTRVSRNLISLEQQELIKREKWGKNFQIYLTDMGKKVIE